MSAGHVDVLIITGLPEKLAAVLALGEGGEAGWRRTKDRNGSTYHIREFVNDRGKPFLVAAGWSGGATIAQRTEELIDDLSPSRIATCGACVGVPGTSSLGDIVVATKVHIYTQLNETLETFHFGSAWVSDAPFITQ